jgi:hypothetical protein
MPKKIFAVFMAVIFLLTGCSLSPATATPTATPQPTRISAYGIDAPMSRMTQRQEYLKNSDLSMAQWNRILAWADYWIKCDNPPFDPAAEIRWDIIWDNPGFPFESFMVIDSGGAFYAVPASNNQWLDPPTTACQGTLDPRYAPLLLATGEDRQWLRVEIGSIIQLNAQGEQVAILYKSFEFDAEKLSHMPASYEYLRDHPEEFVQAPDPWVVGVEKFNQWIDEVLDKALGDLMVRIPNVIADFCSVGDVDYLSAGGGQAKLPIGPMDFFFFTHNGVIYPVYLINAQETGKVYNNCTQGVVLIANFGTNGLDVMEIIYRGDRRFAGSSIWHIPNENFSDDVNSLILAGFGKIDNFEAPRRTEIGIGGINFVPAP